MRGATRVTLQPHQILRLPRKIALQNRKGIYWKWINRYLHCGADSNMIRPWSENKLVISHPLVHWGYLTRYFLLKNIWRSGYLPKFHQMLRLPRKVTLQHPQMLRLPRKVPLNYSFTKRSLYLSYYFTQIIFYWIITLRNSYFIELLLY